MTDFKQPEELAEVIVFDIVFEYGSVSKPIVPL